MKINLWHVSEIGKTGLPYTGSLNGSLWSIFYEFACYLFTLIVGTIGLFKYGIAELFITSIPFYILAIVKVNVNTHVYKETLVPFLIFGTHKWPYLLAYLTGTLCYVFKDKFHFGQLKPVILYSLLTLFFLRSGGWLLVGPIILAPALLSLCYLSTIKLKVDYSYGIYLYHFPVEQLLSSLKLNSLPYTCYFLISVMASVLLAAMSWHLLESKIIKFKSLLISPFSSS